MPTQAAQRTAARAEVVIYTLPTVPPTIDDTTLDAILDSCLRASVWAASTSYSINDSVVPSARNGHSYNVIVAGSSDTTEPTWPTSISSTVSTGASDPQLTFQEAGVDYSNVYDVRKAIHLCAVYKMNQAAALRASGNEQMQQVFDHWKQVSEKFSSIEIA